nr:DUF6461 domain-containing protein [Nocardia bovistercoris]
MGTCGYLALAEHLSGVRITAELLDDAVYSTCLVSLPVRDHRQPRAHSERLDRGLAALIPLPDK